MEIIRPKENFFIEYLNACKESYENNITEWMPFEPDHFDVWKEHILEAYDNYEKGIDIPEGFPRTYTYWCVEGDTFIGEIQIRPFLSENEAQNWGHIAYAIRYSQWNKGYGTRLLKAALDKLREFGVSNIYIACHKTNAISIKVIEKNGGSFINSIIDEEGIEQNVYIIKD